MHRKYEYGVLDEPLKPWPYVRAYINSVNIHVEAKYDDIVPDNLKNC